MNDETETKLSTYLVECEGQVREVYAVEAASEQEAMDRWAHGNLVIQEAYSVEPVSAEVDDV